MLSMLIDGIFHNGAVEARWDDGTIDHYVFADNNTSLMGTSVRNLGAAGGYSPAISGFVRKLRQRSAVQIHVMKWQNELVSGRVELAGSSRAIGALPCSNATARGIPRAPAARRGESAARSWASRVQGGLGTPMQEIQLQLADCGVSPALSRSGDLRMFTYTFADDSQLILAAEPRGAQTGLVLYFVDIQD